MGKFGNSLLLHPLSESAFISMASEDDFRTKMDELFSEYPEKILTSLKNTPNVTKYTQEFNPKTQGSLFLQEDKTKDGNPPGVIPLFLQNLQFEVIWPAKNQDIPSRYKGQVIENFHISIMALSFSLSARAPLNTQNSFHGILD
ncbi:hypothetical protein ACFLU1_04115 [Chloroflexota bacterium]